VTQAIAQFMVDMARAWDEHTGALLGPHDLAAATRHLAAEPSVLHLPVMTGAAGEQAVARFYAEEFVPHLPADLTRTRISRTVDRFRLVDETTVAFTHDRELPWLLPGISPTHRRAEVLTVAIVSYQRGRIRSVRVLWDYATLTAQLGVPTLAALLAE
jgi:carboxymethylenebutenolidase